MITLAPPRALDIRRTFRWLQSDALRRDFMLAKKPTLKGHFSYWRNAVSGRSLDVFFSIKHDGIHVGNCGMKNISDGRAEIWLYIGVDKHRGIGLGNDIMTAIICNARERSINLLYLHVRTDNTNAIKLYRKFGFRDISYSDAKSIGFTADVSILRMERSL